MAFQPRGDMPYVGTYTNENKKNLFCYFIYQHWDNGYWTLEVLKMVNAHSFDKKNKSTQGYLVFGLPVRGGQAIYLPKYKWEEFFSSSDNQFTNNDTVG